jgi:hypothetical protein
MPETATATTTPTKTATPAVTSDPTGTHDEPSSLSGNTNAIAEASKAFRAGKTGTTPAPAAAAATDTAATVADAGAVATTEGDQPRNADGTFATKDGTKAAAGETNAADPETETAETETVDPEVEDPAAAAAAEPKIFKLAGDPQRGEEDIELDVRGLPEEVIKRLEINETRGMRRREFNEAMSRVQKVESDFVEFETMLKMNPEGVVLDYMAPAARLKVGAAILLEHWDELAPAIQSLWEDPSARKLALSELRNGANSLSQQVKEQVETNRRASAIRRAVETTIPEKTDPQDAVAFRAAAHALLATQIREGKEVTPENVPQLLTALAQRYGFGVEQPAATPPARPKLAVINKSAQAGTATRQPPKAATAADGKTPVVSSMSPEKFAAATAGRQAARAVAPQGAGALPVKQPGPPENASIQEASAFLRGSKNRR